MDVQRRRRIVRECPNGSARPEVDCSYVAEISSFASGVLNLVVGTCYREVDDAFLSFTSEV